MQGTFFYDACCMYAASVTLPRVESSASAFDVIGRAARSLPSLVATVVGVGFLLRMPALLIVIAGVSLIVFGFRYGQTDWQTVQRENPSLTFYCDELWKQIGMRVWYSRCAQIVGLSLALLGVMIHLS